MLLTHTQAMQRKQRAAFGAGQKGLLWLILGLFVICGTSASAQSTPAMLHSISLHDVNASETDITFDFDVAAPGTAIVGRDADDMTLFVNHAQEVGGISAMPHETQLVRSVEVSELGNGLQVHLVAKVPVHVTASQDSAMRIVFKVVPALGAAASGSPIGASLPVATVPLPGEDSYELVQLKYADVSEVVGLLTDGLTVKSNDNFVPSEPAFGSSSLTGGAAVAQVATQENEQAPLGQSVDSAVAIDRRLNAIWLKGSPDRIARMKAEIAKIDVPVDSVILETELFELDETGAKAVGLDFANSSSQIGVFTAQSGQFVTVADTANTGSHLTSTSLQGALYAQIQEGHGKVVSRPRIAAQSGGTAKIITGDAVPILTSIALSGVAAVSQQVQYVNAGVTLQIAPRVSADGFVSSHVFCVVSSVTGSSQGYPTISQREAETTATVKDGDTFVVGGLTQEASTSNDSKLPLLGDLPVVGQAFHHVTTTSQKTELYIVITPHIVRRVSSAP